MTHDPDARVLAFRLTRHGLDRRRAGPPAEGLPCPASDVVRDSALLALAARLDGLTRPAYDLAIDRGDVVVAPSVRAAVHAVHPDDVALFGRALIARDEDELAEQLGQGARTGLRAAGIPAGEALDEVAVATAAALAGGRALSKDELHEELRGRVRPALLAWCNGCRSHHVAPMLWRFAGVQVGIRLDAARRFVLGPVGPAREPTDTVRRFLGVYGPSTPGDFTAWTGVPRAVGRRLWAAVADELVELSVGGSRGWLLAEDVDAVASAPSPAGLRLLPPGDPFLAGPNRALLAPDSALRKRLFRSLWSPGVVLAGGRVVGIWRVRTRARGAEFEVEPFGPVDREELTAEAARVAAVRGEKPAVVRLA